MLTYDNLICAGCRSRVDVTTAHLWEVDQQANRQLPAPSAFLPGGPRCYRCTHDLLAQSSREWWPGAPFVAVVEVRCRCACSTCPTMVPLAPGKAACQACFDASVSAGRVVHVLPKAPGYTLAVVEQALLREISVLMRSRPVAGQPYSAACYQRLYELDARRRKLLADAVGMQEAGEVTVVSDEGLL